MEPIGLSLGVLPVFSVCLEYFHLFKTAKAASDESQILLYKLDCEYESFIIWGEKNGFCKTSAESEVPALRKPGVAEKVKAALHLIERLLSDADNMRKKYDVGQKEPQNSLGRQAMDMKVWITKQQQQVPLGQDDAADDAIYLSTSALKRIKWWKTRPQSSNPKLDLIRKSMWAINDRAKFERLVRDIHDLVENLYKILPVKETERNATAIQDIKTISGNLENLRLFEEASIAGYPAWSGVASTIIEASSSKGGPGTISQWMAGLENDEDKSDSDTQSTKNMHFNTKTEEAWFSFPTHYSYKWIFAFTLGCRAAALNTSCGTEKIEISTSGPSFIFDNDIERTWGLRNQLDQAINAKINPDFLDNLIGSIGFELQDTLTEALYPAVTVNIYCPPCRCLVRTALLVCRKYNRLSKYRVRVDDRLPASCCSELDKLQRMRGFANTLYESDDGLAPSGIGYYSWDLLKNLDRVWLEQRVYYLEARVFGIHKSTTVRHQVNDFFVSIAEEQGFKIRPVLMVEANQGAWILQGPPFPWNPIPPKENQLFEVYKPGDQSEPMSKYIGTFTAPKFQTMLPTPLVPKKRRSPGSIKSVRSPKSVKSIIEAIADAPDFHMDNSLANSTDIPNHIFPDGGGAINPQEISNSPLEYVKRDFNDDWLE
ncbi:hypothetical protein TWF694_003187 [Orbilia ellipsospora]|uniref:Prion-inhibition and propagation HeLo domain-containing protein n=1 Tax=Orbilia ellipsospora TaxID=2528407 RepID=A0AAV9X395_9PEZI